MKCQEFLKSISAKVSAGQIDMLTYSNLVAKNCIDKTQATKTSISMSSGPAITSVKELHAKNLEYFGKALKSASTSSQTSSSEKEKLAKSSAEFSKKSVELNQQARSDKIEMDFKTKGYSELPAAKTLATQIVTKIEATKILDNSEEVVSILEFSRELLKLGASKRASIESLPFHLLPGLGKGKSTISVVALGNSRFEKNSEGVLVEKTGEQKENEKYQQYLTSTIDYIQDYFEKNKGQLSDDDKMTLSSMLKHLNGYKYARENILNCIDNDRNLTEITLNYLSSQDLCSSANDVSDVNVANLENELNLRADEEDFNQMKNDMYLESMKLTVMSLLDLNYRYGSSFDAKKTTSEIVDSLCKQEFTGPGYKAAYSATSAGLSFRSETIDVCKHAGIKDKMVDFANRYVSTIKDQEKKAIADVAAIFEQKMSGLNQNLINARNKLYQLPKYQKICQALDKKNTLSTDRRVKMLQEAYGALATSNEQTIIKEAEDLYAQYKEGYLSLSQFRETSLLFTPAMMENDTQNGFFDQGLKTLYPSKGVLSWLSNKMENFQRWLGGEQDDYDRQLRLGCETHQPITTAQIQVALNQAKYALHLYVKGDRKDVRGLNQYLYEDDPKEGALAMFEKNPAALAQVLKDRPQYSKHICELNHLIAKKDRSKAEKTGAFRAMGICSMFAGPVGWGLKAGGLVRVAHLARLTGAVASGASGVYEGTLAFGLKQEATSIQNQVQMGTNVSNTTNAKVAEKYQAKLQEANLAKAMQTLDFSLVSLDLFDGVDAIKAVSRAKSVPAKLLSKLDDLKLSSNEKKAVEKMLQSKPQLLEDSKIKNYLSGSYNPGKEKILKVILGNDYIAEDVVKNLSLDETARIKKIKKEFPHFSDEQVDAVMKAHSDIPCGGSATPCSKTQLKEKLRILSEARIDDGDADLVVRRGHAGLAHTKVEVDINLINTNIYAASELQVGKLEKTFKRWNLSGLTSGEKDLLELFQNIVTRAVQKIENLEIKHPSLFKLINALSLGTIKSAKVFIKKMKEILFSDERLITLGSMPAVNGGINRYLYTLLSKDPALEKMANSYLDRLKPVDKLYVDAVMKRRNENQLLLKHSEIVLAGSPNELIVGDLQWSDFARENKLKFDPLNEMIDSIRENLPKNQQNDPQQIKKYISKMIMLFHDDVEVAGNINMRELPEGFSLMFSDWLGLESKTSKEAVVLFSKKYQDISPGNIPAGYLREGQYHANAAIALRGEMLQDLNKNPNWLDNQILKTISTQSGNAYKHLSTQSHRLSGGGYLPKIHTLILAKIKRNKPLLYTRYLLGQLNIEDFSDNNVFIKMMNDEKVIDDIVLKLGRDNLDSGYQVLKGQIREVIFREWGLWLHHYRALEQHRSASKFDAIIADKLKTNLGRSRKLATHKLPSPQDGILIDALQKRWGALLSLNDAFIIKDKGSYAKLIDALSDERHFVTDLFGTNPKLDSLELIRKIALKLLLNFDTGPQEIKELMGKLAAGPYAKYVQRELYFLENYFGAGDWDKKLFTKAIADKSDMANRSGIEFVNRIFAILVREKSLSRAQKFEDVVTSLKEIGYTPELYRFEQMLDNWQQVADKEKMMSHIISNLGIAGNPANYNNIYQKFLQQGKLDNEQMKLLNFISKQVYVEWEDQLQTGAYSWSYLTVEDDVLEKIPLENFFNLKMQLNKGPELKRFSDKLDEFILRKMASGDDHSRYNKEIIAMLNRAQSLKSNGFEIDSLKGYLAGEKLDASIFPHVLKALIKEVKKTPDGDLIHELQKNISLSKVIDTQMINKVHEGKVLSADDFNLIFLESKKISPELQYEVFNGFVESIKADDPKITLIVKLLPEGKKIPIEKLEILMANVKTIEDKANLFTYLVQTYPMNMTSMKRLNKIFDSMGVDDSRYEMVDMLASCYLTLDDENFSYLFPLMKKIFAKYGEGNVGSYSTGGQAFIGRSLNVKNAKYREEVLSFYKNQNKTLAFNGLGKFLKPATK